MGTNGKDIPWESFPKIVEFPKSEPVSRNAGLLERLSLTFTANGRNTTRTETKKIFRLWAGIRTHDLCDAGAVLHHSFQLLLWTKLISLIRWLFFLMPFFVSSRNCWSNARWTILIRYFIHIIITVLVKLFKINLPIRSRASETDKPTGDDQQTYSMTSFNGNATFYRSR